MIKHARGKKGKQMVREMKNEDMVKGENVRGLVGQALTNPLTAW